VKVHRADQVLIAHELHMGALTRRQPGEHRGALDDQELPAGTLIGDWRSGPVNSIFIDI
jgi:hypothetical protein